jgi:hypothetical protein
MTGANVIIYGMGVVLAFHVMNKVRSAPDVL